MKKILSIALIAGFSFGFSVMPYGGYINYSSDSIKNRGYIGGVYTSIYEAPYKLELDAERSVIKYKNNTPIWSQNDFTAILDFYKGYNYAFKAGIHNIWSHQYNNKYSKIFIAGAQYYKYLYYNIGTDIYYSVYKNFKVYQVSPYVGFNFGDYYLDSFYIEAKINQIYIDKSDAANKQNYTNLSLKITNYYGPFTTTVKAEIGKSAYETANGGFVVYNLGDETQYNYGMDFSYAMNKFTSFKIGYNRTKYKENGLNTKYYSNIYTLSFIKTF